MSRVKYNGFFMGRLITEADVYIFFWIKRGVFFLFVFGHSQSWGRC